MVRFSPSATSDGDLLAMERDDGYIYAIVADMDADSNGDMWLRGFGPDSRMGGDGQQIPGYAKFDALEVVWKHDEVP